MHFGKAFSSPKQTDNLGKNLIKNEASLVCQKFIDRPLLPYPHSSVDKLSVEICGKNVYLIAYTKKQWLAFITLSSDFSNSSKYASVISERC